MGILWNRKRSSEHKVCGRAKKLLRILRNRIPILTLKMGNVKMQENPKESVISSAKKSADIFADEYNYAQLLRNIETINEQI